MYNYSIDMPLPFLLVIIIYHIPQKYLGTIIVTLVVIVIIYVVIMCHIFNDYLVYTFMYRTAVWLHIIVYYIMEILHSYYAIIS